MSSERKAIVRCAIYTRKSSEEGLDMSFNSLDAQREACEAFVLSQKHEGWRILPTRYDDGGYSGGSIDRPALKRLLEDVEGGKIETIVVYKVDRLTRSLWDFAKIVEALDARRVSFVSVTQQFNTTTSMGRLTLNVLLSFAQFEREVTGERIRDKIAASKRKGMWMGGTLPLGYDVKDRKLVVNPEEAKLVHELYCLYLQLKCVAGLKANLDQRGIKSRLRISGTGRQSGGASFSRGALYQILKNRIYLGEISHRNQSYPGEHQAIIQKELWGQVQTQMRSDNQGRRTGLKANSPSLLTGLLQDAQGNRFTPSHTAKNGKRYRYYTCRPKITDSGSAPSKVFALPAHDIEKQVLCRLQSFLGSTQHLMDELIMPEDSPSLTELLISGSMKRASDWSSAFPAEAYEFVRAVVHRVVVCRDRVEIQVKKGALRSALTESDLASSARTPSGPKQENSDVLICLRIQARLNRCGLEMRLLAPPDRQPGEQGPRLAKPLLKALARAHQWYGWMLTGKALSQSSIAKQTGLNPRYVGRVLECAFLAPDIVEAILDGRQPPDLTFQKLTKQVPLSWVEQREQLGFPALQPQR
jgi:site-specific DNA recombinase